MLKFQIAVATAALTANALKVGVISDMHTNLAYDSWVSDADNCVAGGAKATEEAPLGRINCDPSTAMIDFMFQRFTDVYGEVDVLLVPGDFIGHGIAPHLEVAVVSTDWPIVQSYIEASTNLLKKHFPNTLVLPTIGNNDGYHSQAVDESQKSDYYGYLLNSWFVEYPGNA